MAEAEIETINLDDAFKELTAFFGTEMKRFNHVATGSRKTSLANAGFYKFRLGSVEIRQCFLQPQPRCRVSDFQVKCL